MKQHTDHANGEIGSCRQNQLLEQTRIIWNQSERKSDCNPAIHIPAIFTNPES